MKLPHRRQFLHLAAGTAALPAVSRIARAQAYPSRPITMVVAFAAGGSGDTIMRIVADHMRSTLGQTSVVSHGLLLMDICLGKNFLTLLQHWSGAVTCPAYLCGADGRWP
jgi:hypothetical protein